MDCNTSPNNVQQRQEASRAPHVLGQGEALLWREIVRRDWPSAEFQVLRLIMECSLGLGRKAAKIPSVHYFCEYTQQAKPHVYVAINSLKARGVIDEPQEGVYRIIPLFGAWNVPELPRSQAVVEQLELLSPAPDLHDGLMDSFLDLSDLPGAACGASAGRQPERGAEGARSVPSVAAGNAQVVEGARSIRGTGENGQMADAVVLAAAPPSLPRRSLDPSKKSLGGGPDENKDGTDFVLPGGGPGKHEVKAKPCTEFVSAESSMKSGPGAVPGGNGTNFVPVGTKSVSASPPQTPPLYPNKRLTGTRLTGSGTARSVRNAMVTHSEERRLMGLIGEFVGVEDMRGFGGFYRTKAVRNFPQETEEAVAEGRMLVNTGYVFRNRGAWLTRKIAMLVGIGSLKDVSAGPAPQV